jgi:SAM-dependent methyltransferase
MMEKRIFENEDLYHHRVVDVLSFFEMGMMRYAGTLMPDNIEGEKLNLGAGKKHIINAHSLDYPEWDGECQPIPWPNESIEFIHAYHFLEHLTDPRPCLRECQRVLVYGGCMNIVVPLWPSQLAAMDIDHKSIYTERTFRNMFNVTNYSKDKTDWEFTITFQLIMGIQSHNLALFTQLQKERGR